MLSQRYNNVGNSIELKDEYIDGVGPWQWLKQDFHGWKWPKEDWPYHKEYILTYVKNKNVVVQAGGLQGMYPRLLAQHFKRVITFEPSLESYKVLELNCRDCDNIEKHWMALGDKEGSVSTFVVYSENIGMNRVSEGGNVRQTTIDSMRLKECDLIFLDVEGYEYKALKGAYRTINQFKPVLILENNFEENYTKIIDLVGPLGYVVVAKYQNDMVLKTSHSQQYPPHY